MLWTVPLLAGLLAAASCQPQPLVLPEPRLVILGQTGADHSTLANVLLGQSPDCSNCTFTVCDGHDSCTKNTEYAVGSWLGKGPAFTVVVTPGFGGTDNKDTELIDEIMAVLHSAVMGANALILLANKEEERFDAPFQQAIQKMQDLYGEEFWRHTVIGVSHWEYDADSVNKRNFTSKTEENFIAEWNTLLQGKFHIEDELSGVFIDSWSQQPWNLGDALQQAKFTRETGELWTFASEHKVLPFRTIEVSENPSQSIQVTTGAPEYPYPRIVILGQSGVGKSSIANVLAGCAPRDDECFFPVCSGSDSCTKNTSIAFTDHFMGDWTVETYGTVTLVDTPGFGDSTGEDGPLLANMIEVLKNVLGQANMILLCTEEGRFNPSTTKMLLELESMFGRDRLWDNVMIEVTKWAYDQNSIDNREINGINETITLKDINDHIMDITHLDHPLDGIFLDSFAVYKPEDETQQLYLNIYAAQLWETANSMKTFDFYTIEDILEQLDHCRDETEWLNDVIKNNISELAALISENGDQIASNMEDIASNVNNISSNSENIGNNSDQVANNMGAISSNSANIGKNSDQIASNIDDISSNSENIGENNIAVNLRVDDVEEDMTHINDALIGTVIAWLGGKTFALPKGWQKCDGTPILEGPLKGKNTPNLNSESRFLRGGTVAESWTVQDDMVQDHHHGVSDNGHKHTDTGHKHDDGGHTHVDGGHTHIDSGHYHHYLSTNWHLGDDYDNKHTYRGPDQWHHTGQGVMRTDECDLSYCDGYGSKANIQSAKASIQSAQASIQTGHSSIASSHTGISVTGATAANVGSETRPKNIVVEWIIKVT